MDLMLKDVERPTKAVVTAGMPYANGPLHLGHLAGAHVPADVFARWMRMLIGPENVLFVCGTDDHGSTSELAAMKAGQPVRDFIDGVHGRQSSSMARYGISIDHYNGTSRPDCFPAHRDLAQDMLRRLHRNGMLEKRVSCQWYDPSLERFLQDRFVRGTCPNPRCASPDAYSDTCDACGNQYDPADLIDPRSALSDAVPVLKETTHWWLDLWKVAETLRVWIQGREGVWRMPVFNEVIHTVLPSLAFSREHEDAYKAMKGELPEHKSKFAAGRRLALQFGDRAAMERAMGQLAQAGIEAAPVDAWAHRSITRDVSWGIPVPPEVDPDLAGKTLYVWPDSLIAPISFTRAALVAKGQDPKACDAYWRDPRAKVYQFLGQDNVFFYTLMQGALWLGSQEDPHHLPGEGDLQLTDIFGCFHLMVDGQKMSKSLGNFHTADDMLDKFGHSADQVRYFLSLLSLPEKRSNFDFANFEERNRFLAGPMNAAFERPLSAAHSKFGGVVPDGELLPEVAVETERIVKRYLESMPRAEYSTLLFAIENYARLINSLFNKYKPHDDRRDEKGRRDALYSCFHMLRTLCIMLHPFVPETMDRLRKSLRLPEDLFRVEELGRSMPAGHAVEPKDVYFPAMPEREQA